MKVLIIFGIILFALFYWFQLRPANIKSECGEWVRDHVNKSSNPTVVMMKAGSTLYQI